MATKSDIQIPNYASIMFSLDRKQAALLMRELAYYIATEDNIDMEVSLTNRYDGEREAVMRVHGSLMPVVGAAHHAAVVV
jgi:hypothetical protein